jgi:hypothetical protein
MSAARFPQEFFKFGRELVFTHPPVSLGQGLHNPLQMFYVQEIACISLYGAEPVLW